MRRFLFIACCTILLMSAVPRAHALNIDSVYKYAWGENIGWINFGSTEGDVDVTANEMDGYAWGENIGWISLSCANTSSCGSVDYSVTISGPTVAGYAWGENIGWVSFNCSNTSSCGTGPGQVDYGVVLDTATGDFSGYAWSENVGWIVFNCTTTSSCGDADYKLKTTAPIATPTPASPAPSGGGGFIPSPSATVVPSVSPTGTVRPPVVSPVPSPGPTPSVFPTPPTTPPPATPTASPQPVPPPVFVGLSDHIADALDYISRILFGTLCTGPLGLAACGSTVLTALDVLLSLLAALLAGELFAFFGFRNRAPAWGVVYESGTKRPIPYPRVQLQDSAGRIVETRYGDRDGRFGFKATPASLNVQELRVQIVVSKRGFRFPSQSTIQAPDYVVYENIYKGGQLSVRRGTVPNISIPMDCVSRAHMLLSGFGHGLVGTTGDRVLWMAFGVGLVTVPLWLWFTQSATAFAVAALFILANAYRILVLYRPYGITREALTGKPLPFSLVVLGDGRGNRQGFAVSDEYGRYTLPIPAIVTGHDITAYSPAVTVPRRMVGSRVPAGKGFIAKRWITEQLRI